VEEGKVGYEMEQKLEGLEQDLGGRRSMVKVMNGGFP